MNTLVQFFSGISLGLLLQPFPVNAARDPAFCQIIISEIMADPTPPVMLPEAEYIELFNRGNTAVNLEGWRLAFGKHEKTLSAAIIEPNSYLIICEKDHEPDFQAHGKTLPVSGMPAVVNTGQTLILRSVSGAVVHTVTFSPAWYKTHLKSEGGWSLEIMDPDNPCGYSENWSESGDSHGGTPGSVNSVKTSKPDKHPPFLLRAILPNDSSALLLFSERMDSLSISSAKLYSVNGGVLHPLMVNPAEPDYAEILLTYPGRFQPFAVYTVSVLNSIKDCAGNSLEGNSFVSFAIPQVPSGRDLIINEILFNPVSDESEFIELYNRSDKVLDLADFSIALADKHTGDLTRRILLNKHPFLMFPDSYVIITGDAVNLPDNTFTAYRQVLVEESNLFSLPDEEGIIVLSNSLLHTIDEFHYNQSMHADLLALTEGVSLERIDCNVPASSPENWHSASTVAGSCTPGRSNSQTALAAHSPDEITLMPEVISPDNDGIDDYATLHLQLHEPGWMATIQIFDIHGNKIKNLITKSILGTEVHFTWDGTLDDQRPATMGIYLVYIEMFRSSGEIKKIKKVVTVTRRL